MPPKLVANRPNKNKTDKTQWWYLMDAVLAIALAPDVKKQRKILLLTIITNMFTLYCSSSARRIDTIGEQGESPK